MDVQKRAVKCSEGCQCTNCENTISLPCDREDLAEIALEEQVESNIATNEDDEEFAEFIFAAAFDDTSIRKYTLTTPVPSHHAFIPFYIMYTPLEALYMNQHA